MKGQARRFLGGARPTQEVQRPTVASRVGRGPTDHRGRSDARDPSCPTVLYWPLEARPTAAAPRRAALPERWRVPSCTTPSLGSFGPAGTMTAPPGTHTATLLHDGTVLIAGGASYAGIGMFDGSAGSAELYTPDVMVRRPVLASASLARTDHLQYFTRASRTWCRQTIPPHRARRLTSIASASARRPQSSRRYQSAVMLRPSCLSRKVRAAQASVESPSRCRRPFGPEPFPYGWRTWTGLAMSLWFRSDSGDARRNQ